jgi:hypothetical protein
MLMDRGEKVWEAPALCTLWPTYVGGSGWGCVPDLPGILRSPFQPGSPPAFNFSLHVCEVG